MPRKINRELPLAEKTVEFFWKRVTKSDDGCWLWRTGRGNLPKKYGSISVYGGYGDGIYCISAHRASWIIHNGPILDEEAVVMHECDNPACVRPDHLRLGTQSQNIRDSFSRGRKVSGYAVAQSKKTHCPSGHSYDEENTGRTTYFLNGKIKNNRYCRTCHRLRARERRAEKG